MCAIVKTWYTGYGHPVIVTDITYICNNGRMTIPRIPDITILIPSNPDPLMTIPNGCIYKYLYVYIYNYLYIYNMLQVASLDHGTCPIKTPDLLSSPVTQF